MPAFERTSNQPLFETAHKFSALAESDLNTRPEHERLQESLPKLGIVG